MISMVTDGDALDTVTQGPDGILAGLRPGSIYLDMSTVSPHTSRTLAERVASRGAAMLAAPVSGSVQAVEEGTLTIIAGGPADAFEHVEPILRQLGRTVTYVGDAGHALLLKLAINISLAVQMLAFSEGVLLAEQGGVDRNVALQVMTHSAIGSPMLQARAAAAARTARPRLVRCGHDAKRPPARTRLRTRRRRTHALHHRGRPDAQHHPRSRVRAPRHRRRVPDALRPGRGATRSDTRIGRGVTSTAENTRTPGRPRSEKAHKAILAAAMELLFDQGLHAMSMDEVARRAGVSKATIYRWWPSKERLALDALATEWASTPPAGQRHTGSLRGDLLTRFLPWLRQLNHKPYARVVAGLVAEAQTNPEFAELYRQHFVQARRDATRELLVQARDRGEIAANHRPRSHPRPALRPHLPPPAARPRPPHRAIRPTSHRLRHHRNIRERTHRTAMKLRRQPGPTMADRRRSYGAYSAGRTGSSPPRSLAAQELHPPRRAATPLTHSAAPAPSRGAPAGGAAQLHEEGADLAPGRELGHFRVRRSPLKALHRVEKPGQDLDVPAG